MCSYVVFQRPGPRGPVGPPGPLGPAGTDGTDVSGQGESFMELEIEC